MNHLVVTAEFEHNGEIFARGRRVIDAALIADLQQHQPHSVLRVPATVEQAVQSAAPKRSKAAA